MTSEEIAREAAEGLVTACVVNGKQWCASLKGFVSFSVADEASADRLCEAMREILAGAIQAAIERALAAAPVPGGMSEERLAEIRRDQAAVWSADGPSGAVEELLTERAHLVRALHDCGQDGSAGVWAGGYEAGSKALAEEMIELRKRERKVEGNKDDE